MKKRLLYLLLLISGVAGAQNIAIPDANFKARLLLANTTNTIALNASNQNMKIDSNNDGEIQQSEAALVYTLRLHNTVISSLEGLQFFTSLKRLECKNNQLPAINLTGLSNLTYLQIINNNIQSLDLTPAPNLTYLSCGNNNLMSLNVTGQLSLETLNCSNNQIDALDLTGLTLLQDLSCSDNQITQLNVSALQQLEYFGCSNNPISQLNLSGLSNLKTAYIQDLPLTMLTLAGLTNLEVIFIQNSLLTEIDLSSSPNLAYFHFDNNALLSSVNLNNGGIVLYPGELSITNNPLLNFICVDEDEDVTLLEYFEMHNLSPVPMGTDCETASPGNYNGISGTITFDWDNNGCAGLDPVASYMNIELTNGTDSRSKFTDMEGNFLFYTEDGNFTLTPSNSNPIFTFVPASASVTFEEMDGSSSNLEFCLTANGIHPDVEVILMPLTIANPGFDAIYKIVYRNTGNQVLSGDLTFSYNDAVLDYVSSTPAVASSATGALAWNYANLMPFEGRTVVVTLNLNAPTETPPLVTGDMLALTAAVTSTGGDDNPADNTFTFDQVVSGSFDPNNIICLEGATEAPEAIGDYLHYVINFEYIEEVPATFVVVTNEIDTDKYDMSTLQIMNSSHQVETTVTGNIIEFRFDDINLGPDVYGNVSYKIKTRSTLEVGDHVSNDAVIVFDFNEPLPTNDAVTTFTALGINKFSGEATVSLHPNPSQGILNVTAKSEIETIELYDIQGRLLQSSVINAADAILDITERQAGMYLLKVKSTNGTVTKKIVRQ